MNKKLKKIKQDNKSKKIIIYGNNKAGKSLISLNLAQELVNEGYKRIVVINSKDGKNFIKKERIFKFKNDNKKVIKKIIKKIKLKKYKIKKYYFNKKIINFIKINKKKLFFNKKYYLKNKIKIINENKMNKFYKKNIKNLSNKNEIIIIEKNYMNDISQLQYLLNISDVFLIIIEPIQKEIYLGISEIQKIDKLFKGEKNDVKIIINKYSKNSIDVNIIKAIFNKKDIIACINFYNKSK